jgi:regulatory protein
VHSSCETETKKQAQKIRRLLLHLLMRRDYTQHELVQKMLVKGYEQDLVTRIITAFVEDGTINETRFIENFIYFRRNRGYGPLRIAAELKARGLSAEMIAKHLEISDNAWLDCAEKIWCKHFKNTPPKDASSKNKQQRFMQGRGFTWEQIQHVLRVVLSF